MQTSELKQHKPFWREIRGEILLKTDGERQYFTKPSMIDI